MEDNHCKIDQKQTRGGERVKNKLTIQVNIRFEYPQSLNIR